MGDRVDIGRRGPLSERFVLAHEVGRGAMGVVHQGTDTASGERVAIKLSHDGVDPRRGLDEAHILSKIDDPHVVRYLHHEADPTRPSYLVMEWLAGGTLATRLSYGKLHVSEMLELGTAVSSGLSAVHQAGFVHCDLKPENIFLPAGLLASAKIADFGVARPSGSSTVQGRARAGTPAYMSPEQARGNVPIEPSSDIWSLGCVLVEALTGQPAFRGPHTTAVLAQVLACSVRVRDWLPHLETPLQELLQEMLCSNAAGRPSASTVFARLVEASEAFSSKTGGALARPTHDSIRSWGEHDGERVECVALVGPASSGVELAPDQWTAEAHGARVSRLGDGVIVLSFSQARAPKEQVLAAARCLQTIRTLHEDVAMALVTGRARRRGDSVIGGVVERGAELLRTADRGVTRIDGTSAAFLEGRFSIAPCGAGRALLLERAGEDAPHTLLGRPSPCVGRDHEILHLVQCFEHVSDEREAAVMLVIGAAGAGKSRLGYEVLKTLRASHPDLVPLIGRGDPLRAGSPFEVLEPALRAAADILPSDPLESQRQKLHGRVARTLVTDSLQAAALLGEIAGVPFPSSASEGLRMGRENARLLSDRLLTAWLDWVEAECDRGPVLFLLDDLHWADVPSVQLIDAALRNFRDKPLMVVGLARQQVHEQFPRLWHERNVTTLELPPLSRRAQERLLEGVLGSRIGAEERSSMIERAQGNALFLEELVRAFEAGASPLGGQNGAVAMPDSLLGMVQARLDGQGSTAKRLLAAGSLFGQTFSRQGVNAVLGGEFAEDEVTALLATLVEREMLQSVQRGGDEFRLSHSLVREGAYACLSQMDREEGHVRAAEFLAAAGTERALVIAEHFERGQRQPQASLYYGQAAEEALSANDLAGVIACVDKALACGASEPRMGELCFLKAEAHQWRGENEKAAHCSEEAQRFLLRGSALWFRAKGALSVARARSGDAEALVALLAELLVDAREVRLSPDHVIGLATAACSAAGLAPALVGEAVDYIREHAHSLDESPHAKGWVHAAQYTRAYELGDPWLAKDAAQAGLSCLQRTGDLRGMCATQANLGVSYLLLGQLEQAEELLAQAEQLGERMGICAAEEVRLVRGVAAAWGGREDEAEARMRHAVQTGIEQDNRYLLASARRELARLLLHRGDFLEAEQEGARAAALEPGDINAIGCGLAVRALSLVGQGRLEEARALVDDLEAASQKVTVMELDAFVRLAVVELQMALGLSVRARASLALAVERLRHQAGRIDEPVCRETFLRRVPVNARLLQLDCSQELVSSSAPAVPLQPLNAR